SSMSASTCTTPTCPLFTSIEPGVFTLTTTFGLPAIWKLWCEASLFLEAAYTGVPQKGQNLEESGMVAPQFVQYVITRYTYRGYLSLKSSQAVS
ncbi:MAG: hypothetical protein OK457_10560, partial [Thaumarchaeota archaeon]|nr:hypothetical protein [Nitrososphaerota archaeon]